MISKCSLYVVINILLVIHIKISSSLQHEFSFCGLDFNMVKFIHFFSPTLTYFVF